ncbi:MAG: methyltransferase domain-containing protein [Bacteroidota bacterium]
MVKQLVYPLYKWSHKTLFQTRNYNPFFRKIHGGKPVLEGHISAEHLANPQLDQELAEAIQQLGVSVLSHKIDVQAYDQYIKDTQYPDSYYGGGLDPASNFVEKTLEHYVSTEFIEFGPETVFVDIAACTSPFYQIVRKRYGCKETYQQDLIFAKGLHGDKIGGWAHELVLPDQHVDAITLHCSLEHFEDNSDTLFFQELERVLKPGGKAIILPFYLAKEYTIHVDPAYNLLKFHRPSIDPKATLRYCDWSQFFSRHYDQHALQERILQAAPQLSLTLYKVENFLEVDPRCYLRFIGVFEKKS